MIIGDIVQQMQPNERLIISGENQFGAGLERIWTDALTDAQKYAYWQKEVLCHTVDQTTNTICCIVRE